MVNFQQVKEAIKDLPIWSLETAAQRSDLTGLDCSKDPSLTKQSFAEEVDINNIVKRFVQTGEIPYQERLSAGQYLDVSTVEDYQTALEIVREADAAFSDLPATLRERFKNDPAKLLEFVEGASKEELINAGLAKADSPSPALSESSTGADAPGGVKS